MRIKKLLAVLLSAALALTIFAGCGNQSLLQLLLNLLQDQYQNITVTAEDDLEATLRQAVRENDTLEEIDAALEAELLPTIEFERLRSARAGDQTFDLVFKAGSNTQAIARQTYTEWNTVFGSLPSSGRYYADLATVQADNGYYILVNVTIKKGGSSGSSSDGSSGDGENGDQPDETLRDYIRTQDGNYVIYTNKGLQNVFLDNMDEVDNTLMEDRGKNFDGITIKLSSTRGATYSVNGQLMTSFAGELESETDTVTIGLSGQNSLFGMIEDDGAVQNIIVDVKSNINNTNGNNVGVITGENNGSVKGCQIKLNGHTVSGSDVGGAVGINFGIVEGCAVEGGTILGTGNKPNVGGVVGKNTGEGKDGTDAWGKVLVCYSTSTVTGTRDNSFVGGVVGLNIQGAVKGCYHTGGTVTAAGVGSMAGGVVGQNGRGEDSTNSKILGSIYACYWNGNQDVGIGNWEDKTEYQNEGYQPAYGTPAGATAKNKVPDGADWSAAMNAMSGYSSSYRFAGTMGDPQLVKK